MAQIATQEKSTTTQTPPPNPAKIFDTFFGALRAHVLRAAVDLDLFTALADGPKTANEIAKKINASERGARILGDYLAANGFLTKSNDRYALTEESGAFLNRKSPMFIGSMGDFLLSDYLVERSRVVKDSIVEGGCAIEDGLSPEHPMWVDFAHYMAPMSMLPAQMMAEHLGPVSGKVVDIAAGHGMYGIAVAKKNPDAHIYAVDWPNVLQVATENAGKMGVGDRYHLSPGSAFEVDLGNDNNVVLVPNFVHHFNQKTVVDFLKKVHAALKPGGKVAIVDFVPNEDRVSPPMPASFSMQMLAGTKGGDAYTEKQYHEMLAEAGFKNVSRADMLPSPMSLITAVA
jgi:ubiquinone/menaquinone biosynthesis C-methylase UbiE